jgi:hypothetical protein
MAERNVTLVGVIDAAEHPGSDVQRARESLRSCDRVVAAQDANLLAPTDWVISLRANEWLADDAVEAIRRVIDSSVGVAAFRLGVAYHIGEKVIQCPERLMESVPRLVCPSAMMLTDLQVEPVDLPLHPVHFCLARDLREFAESVLPNRSFPVTRQPAEVMERYFSAMNAVARMDQERDLLSAQVAILTVWAYVQRCMVNGVFDQSTGVLKALQHVPSSGKQAVVDAETVARICRENGVLALEHARHHLHVANTRIAEIETALQAAQHQIERYERSPMGWLVKLRRRWTRIRR